MDRIFEKMKACVCDIKMGLCESSHSILATLENVLK